MRPGMLSLVRRRRRRRSLAAHVHLAHARFHLRAGRVHLDLIDETVAIGVEPVEMLVGVGAHLVAADLAVMVGIEQLKPAGTVMAMMTAHRAAFGAWRRRRR